MPDEPIDVVAVIAEQRIREAMERGEFDNLAGQGEPLDLDDLSAVPPELRAAYRLLKSNRLAPPEVELRKEIGVLEAELAQTTDPQARKRLQAKIAEKSIAFDIMMQRWQRQRKTGR